MKTNERKVLQPNDKIVESLLRLKGELWEKQDDQLREVFFKINSCLYSEYPHGNHNRAGESNG